MIIRPYNVDDGDDDDDGLNGNIRLHYITIVTWCMLINKIKSSSSVLQRQ